MLRMYDVVDWDGIQYKTQDLGGRLNQFVMRNQKLYKVYPSGHTEEFWYTGVVEMQSSEIDEHGLKVYTLLVDLHDGSVQKISARGAEYKRKFDTA